MIERGGWLRAATGSVVLLGVVALGCREEAAAPPAEPDVPRFEMNGFMVPERQIDDPTLVDSCLLLTAANPQGMLKEPLAPISRMSNVCLAVAESTPTLDHSLTVELRHPEQVELDNGGVPTNVEQFWVAEGGGVGLMGGQREGVQQLEGIGDFSVWYPMTGGMALHAYWQGKYILAINVRGVDAELGLAWAKEVALKAIQASQEHEKKQQG